MCLIFQKLTYLESCLRHECFMQLSLPAACLELVLEQTFRRGSVNVFRCCSLMVLYLIAQYNDIETQVKIRGQSSVFSRLLAAF